MALEDQVAEPQPTAEPTTVVAQPADNTAQTSPEVSAPLSGPPKWSDVTATPKFQQATPHAQLVAFSRWHDLAYNHATQQPDWNAVKDQFNTRASELEQGFKAAAGVGDINEAKVKVAEDAIAKANAQDSESRRAALRPLGGDVVKAYYEKLAPQVDFSADHQTLNAMREYGSAAGAEIFKGLAALSSKAAQSASEPSILDNFLPDPFNVREENRAGAKQFGEDAAKYWGERVKAAGAQSQVDPGLADTVPATLARGIGATTPLLAAGEVGLPYMALTGAASAYGGAKSEGQSDDEAEMAGVKSLIGLAAFGGAGKLAAFGAAKFLPEGASTLRAYAQKFLSAYGANESTTRALAAWDAAESAAPGEKIAAAAKAFSGTPDVSTEIFNLGFAHIATKHGAAPKAPPEVTEKIDAAKPLAPQTAAAAEKAVQQQQAEVPVPETPAAAPEAVAPEAPKVETPAPAAEGPDVGLKIQHTAAGESVQLQVNAKTTVEQLQAFGKNIAEGELPDASKAEVAQQIQTEIANREAAKPAEVTAPAVEPAAPTPAAAPEAAQPAEVTAPAVETAAPTDPNAYTPAVRTADGEIIKGDKGQTHDDFKVPAALAAEATPDRAGAILDAEHGFVDEAGNFFSREATGKALGDTAMTSQKLRKLQTAPTPEPVAPTPEPVAPTPEARLAAPAEPLKPAPPARPLPTEQTPLPTQAAVAKEAAVATTPEEKAARSTKGEEQLLNDALESGILPDTSAVVTAAGRTGAKEMRQRIAARLAEEFPPEALPEGARETSTKTTNGPLPSVIETRDGPNGPIEVVRPKFTNDADVTARQIDSGQVGLDAANRLYIPDEIAKEGKVNPAIRYGKEKDTGRYYVRGAESKFGEITAPDQYSKAAKDAGAYKKSQGEVVISPEDVVRLNDVVNGQLRDRGVEQAAIDAFDAADEAPKLEPGESETQAGSKGAPNPILVQENHQKLDDLGLTTGKPSGEALFSALLRLVGDERVPANVRVMARYMLETHRIGNVRIRLATEGDANWAGRYSTDENRITLNRGVEHFGGIETTLLHELGHHVTLEKFLAPKTEVERASAANVKRLRARAISELYKAAHNGDAGTHAAREAWAVEEANTNRALYGLKNGQEFIVESWSNKGFAEKLDSLDPHDAVPGAKGENRSLLTQLRDTLRTLFLGGKKPDTLLTQTVDNFLQIAESKPEAATSGAEAQSAAGRPDYAGMDRARIEEEVLRRDPEAMVDTMTKQEMIDSLTGGMAPESADIKDSGWLGPDGKFTSAPGGNHKDAALGLMTSDPKLSKAFKEFMKKESRGMESADEIYKFMQDHGFSRVVHGGTEIYASGKLSTSQARRLKDQAIEQGVSLIHDFGQRSRTLYSPDAFSAAATGGVPSDPTAARIETTVGKDGKVTAELKVEDHATPADLVALKNALPTMKGLSPQTVARLNQQLAVQLGPTMQVRAAKGKVVFGYDSVNNIANTRGRQQANSIALDFAANFGKRVRNVVQKLTGLRAKPSEAELLDRQAAPFVVEAGGDRNELVKDLNQVANATNPDGSPNQELRDKFAPIVQHALDNFDRLHETTQHYREVIKDQLERERGAGISIGEIDNYVTRLLESPDAGDKLLPGSGGGPGGRYFAKGRVFEKLADAINKGYAPKSTDLVDLTQRRIESGERLVQQKALENELRTIKAPDGRQIIGDTEDYQSLMGNKETRVPAGYSVVQTGGRPLVVHNDFKKLFQALYGDSTINTALKRGAGFIKQNTLLLDTFHVGRIMFKELGYSKGANRVGYNNGLALLEYAPEDLKRAVATGDISQKMADYVTEKLPSGQTRAEAAQTLLKNGLNVGKVSDNLLAEHSLQIPYIKDFNPWVFQKLSRGAMVQTAIENFERNLARFPERGADGNARQVAKEMNETFGNLQNQGLFKNKSYQDALRVALLAPQWTESQLRAELRGFGQIGNVAKDVVAGLANRRVETEQTASGEVTTKTWDPQFRLRLGTAAQGQLSIILGMLAANQVVNYLTTGHSTFTNKGDHKLDAFIPPGRFGGKFGLWFSPLEIGAEYAHMAMRYYSQHQQPIDIVSQIARNKLGAVGRAATTAISARDSSGRALTTTGDRVTAAISDLVPIPIGASAFIEKDPRQLAGFRANRQPGSAGKQLLASAGLKTANAQSPQSEIYALAYPFRPDKSYSGPVDYKDLRASLETDQPENTVREIQLLAKRGKTQREIEAAMGIGVGGVIAPQSFAGSLERERAFKKALSPEQLDLYKQAQASHKDSAKKLHAIIKTLDTATRDELKSNRKPTLPTTTEQ